MNKHYTLFLNYFALKKNIFPYIDAKIAVSKDYYTINKNSKWITNLSSRNRGHLLRSQYDCIISTAKSINKDNSLLNCRLNGFDHSKPDLVIIDLKLKIKKNLNVFKLKDKRKITIITSKINSKKIPFFRNKGVKIDFINSLKNRSDFIVLFKILRKYDYNRIFLESGLSFLNTLVRNKLIFNLYVFQSSQKVGKFGKNPLGIYLKKKMNIRNKIKVNLQGDDLYNIKIN